MSGDTIAQQSVGSILTSYASSALAKYGLGPSGKGRMAARGAAAAAAKASLAQFNQNLMQERLTQAYADFGRTNPYEAGFAVSDIVGAPSGQVRELTAWEQKQSGLFSRADQTKRVKRAEAKLQRRIDTRKNALAPYTQFRVAELYGPNAGYWREQGAPPPLWLTGGNPL